MSFVIYMGVGELSTENDIGMREHAHSLLTLI